MCVCMYSTYIWYTCMHICIYVYIKQLQICYWICKIIVYVNNYNIIL